MSFNDWESLFSFFFFCFIAMMGTAKAGLDFYEIYLGKQLLIKRYVNQPLRLENLSLQNAKAGEYLSIHYYQCNAPGGNAVNRSIAIKDDQGAIIKEWKFADVKGPNNAMIIPLKELLQWQRKSNSPTLSLFYNADGRKGGETLAYLPSGSNAVSRRQSQLQPAQTLMASLLFLRVSCFN